MAKLILLRAINLSRYMSCSILEGWPAPWTTSMCLKRLDFLNNSCHCAVVALIWQAGQGDEWQVIRCLRKHQMMEYVRSLFFSTMRLVNFFLEKKTLKQKLQGKETSGKDTIMHTSTTRLSCISSSSLLFPSISSSSSSPSFFSSSSPSFSSSFRRFGRPLGPPFSPAGTSRFKNNDKFDVIHRLHTFTGLTSITRL